MGLVNRLLDRVRNGDERRFEKNPLQELNHEAARGEDIKRNLAKFSADIDAFRLLASQNFNTVYDGYQDLIDAYRLINELMVRTIPADPVKANSKPHYDRRKQSNCANFHICTPENIEHLNRAIIVIAERQSHALRIILNAWERHPLVQKLTELYLAQEQLKKYRKRWEQLIQVIQSVNDPMDIYKLKKTEEFFNAMENTRVNIEARSGLSGREYMQEVGTLRSKALAAIDRWKAKTQEEIRQGLPFAQFG